MVIFCSNTGGVNKDMFCPIWDNYGELISFSALYFLSSLFQRLLPLGQPLLLVNLSFSFLELLDFFSPASKVPWEQHRLKADTRFSAFAPSLSGTPCR
eukprot:UN15849